MRDLNGDGKPDMAVGLAGGSVSFLLGKGDGSFSTGKKVSTSQSLNSVAVADVNGDGKADVVAADHQSNTVSVLLGNGVGTFQGAQTYAAGVNPVGVEVRGFNGGRRTDVVVTDSGFDHGNTGDPPQIVVSVLLGNCDGTLQSVPACDAGGAHPLADLASNFNYHGKLDLAVANAGINGVTNAVMCLVGNGDGTFQAPSMLLANASGFAIAEGDIIGDGVPDLVATTTIGPVVLTGLSAWMFATSVTAGPVFGGAPPWVTSTAIAASRSTRPAARR